jgi:hemoglobin
MDTLYVKIGKQRLRQTIENFYDIIFNESSIRHLFKGDKIEIQEKQILFLTQFLGGPQLYSETHGHPKMRLRHMPHEIDEAAKDEWLRCMKKAIDSMNFENNLGDALYNCFPLVAQHMVNC